MRPDEREFFQWLDSIEFVDESGNIVTPAAGPDISDDPEGDRSTE